jgi:hypothetical protein
LKVLPAEGLTGLTCRQARAAEQLLIEPRGPGVLANKIYGIAANRLGPFAADLTEARTLLRAFGYLL